MKKLFTALVLSLSVSAQFYIYCSNGDVLEVDSISLVKPDNSNNQINNHEYVDLGLPSGLKWATCNVGATKPEEYGDYFAWGEVKPKETYNWSTYKYCVDNYDNLTKYCNYSDYGKNGFTDTNTVLDPEDDAATANWGGAWRMPTDAEFTELREKCKWTWTTQNGVKGYKVVGPNGYSIFLPATGYVGYRSLGDVGSYGNYWSSSRTSVSYCAYSVDFGSSLVKMHWSNRCFDKSVRPVCPKKQEHEWVDLGLSVKWATCNVGATKPEEYGDYFAWGEVEPKETYIWSTYKYSGVIYDQLTKYCNNSRYGQGGFVDNKIVLDPKDDAATANWGGAWRMPTKAEQDELRKNCTWTRTTQNGVDGYKVIGPNGNSIFLPAAGYMDEGTLYFARARGHYWSSSLYTGDPDGAYCVYFGLDYVGWGGYGRYYGQSVRPVCQ